MTTRKSNFELLRIVLMLFVVAEHLLPQIGDIQNIGDGYEYYLGNLFRSFFIVAVNGFVLLSGYFGIKLNFKKILKMESMVLFYNLSGLLLAIGWGMHTLDIKSDVLYLIPTIARKNWFVTIYFVLCLFSPIFNWVISKLNKMQLRIVIVLMIIVFYLAPTLEYTINAQTITMDSGYGIVNFTCLYFIGGYARLYISKQNRLYGYTYIISCLLLFGANHIMSMMFGFYFNSYISYDSIFCLAGAISLFLFFRSISLQSTFINRIAGYSFAVYILHTSLFYGETIFNIADRFNTDILWYIMIVLIAPVLTYAFSMAVEFIRRKIFGKLEDMIISKILTRDYINNLLSRLSSFNQI